MLRFVHLLQRFSPGNFLSFAVIAFNFPQALFVTTSEF
jgi:hypothetical protein